MCVHVRACPCMMMCTNVNKQEASHTSAAFIGIMKKKGVMVEKDKPLRCLPQTLQPQPVLVLTQC